MSKTVAIIQARMSSTRLPGKVLMPIADRTMIDHVVHRVQQAKLIDDVVVATSSLPADEPLIQHCRNQGWNHFSGHPTNVLNRYFLAARQFKADRIVRITSDCPLIDPEVIDWVVQFSDESPQADLVSNVVGARTFPRGLDVELITQDALLRLHENANLARYREHVTLAAYEHPKQFETGSVTNTSDLSHHRWTVDTAADLELVRCVYQHFRQPLFGMNQIVAAFQTQNHWRTINQHIQQKVA